MRQIHRWLIGALCFVALLLMNRAETLAADTGDYISVTVPSSLDITFQADGTNAVADFAIVNESAVPIHITHVNVTSYNGWELVSEQSVITVNQKKLAFDLGGKHLSVGSNAYALTVSEHSQKALNVAVKRGAWNRSYSAEKAFAMEFVYEVGTKEFQLQFDGNGSEEEVESLGVQNGETIALPMPERTKYKFLGWQDEEGNLYNDTFTMPIGDVNLTAQWQWMEAYAIYSADDKSLTFVRSVEPITEGSAYQGKTVTNVYTGFEETVYQNYEQIPWFQAGGVWGSDITTVMVQDVIQPKSTSFWFFCMRKIATFELGNMDMSQVVSMTSMFSSTGEDVTGTFSITGIGQWDTSNVKRMGTAFRSMGCNAKNFMMDDISHWNTASVTDMLLMFYNTGANGDWSLDCSGWNVDNVTNHGTFNGQVEDKVIPPKWVQ